MTAFLASIGYIFMAEMGDKTQLVALAFAARYPIRTVLAGVFWATLLVHLISVGLGAAASHTLPVFWIRLAAGLAFIGFGAWTLRGDRLGDEETRRRETYGPFLTVATTFFLAELGDKTMLATVTIASQYPSLAAVWMGSTLGMVLADGLAVWAGHALGLRLPERQIRYGAAAIFFASGLYLLFTLPR